MSRWGVVTLRVLDALEQHGPMTRAEIMRIVNAMGGSSHSVLHRLTRVGDKTPKRIYISGWRYDDDEGRRYPRAIYALGDKADAPKPKPDLKQQNRDRWQRYKGRVQASSVFNLAITQRQRREMVNAIRGQAD